MEVDGNINIGSFINISSPAISSDSTRSEADIHPYQNLQLTGTLTAERYFSDGEVGFLYIGAQGNAFNLLSSEVPLPSTLLLLGSGLLGLAGWSRFRKN
jgi:hypothetical protein